jgi:hypothetical protein
MQLDRGEILWHFGLRCSQARCTFRWLVRPFCDEWSLVINLLAPYIATECSSGIGNSLALCQTRRKSVKTLDHTRPPPGDGTIRSE